MSTNKTPFSCYNENLFNFDIEMLSLSMSRRCFYKSQSLVRQLATDAAAGSESVSLSSMSRPIVERGTGITIQQRAALRAARKERAAKFLESQGVEGAKTASKGVPMIGSRMVWYLGLGVPTAIITWGCVDSSSPPATLSRYIGLTDFIRSYTDEIARPAHEKLLPDWSQVRKLGFFLFGSESGDSLLDLH